jgi:hypothetical protein
MPNKTLEVSCSQIRRITGLPKAMMWACPTAFSPIASHPNAEEMTAKAVSLDQIPHDGQGEGDSGGEIGAINAKRGPH